MCPSLTQVAGMKFEDLPTLEQKCDTCGGRGSVPYTYTTWAGLGKRKKEKKVVSTTTCHNCRGKGKLLTPFGSAVIEFVKNWSSWDDEISDLKYDLRNRT